MNRCVTPSGCAPGVERSFAASTGGYLDHETSDLSDRCDAVPTENWLLRPGSIATYLARRDFSYYGLVGNDAVASYLYKLAALQVSRAIVPGRLP